MPRYAKICQVTCPHTRCDCRRQLQHSTRSSGGKKFDGRECRAETSLQSVMHCNAVTKITHTDTKWCNMMHKYDRHNSKWSSMSIHGNWLPGFIVIHWNTETLRQKHGETFDDISKILRFSVCTFSGLRICIGPTPEVHQGGEKRPTEDDQKRHHDRHVPCSRKVPGPNAQRSQHAADLKSTKGCYSDLIT